MPNKRRGFWFCVACLAASLGCSNPAPPAVSEDQAFESGADFSGSHILIAFAGSERATPDITRTREEALQKAQELINRLQADPSQFAELAKTESDGPSGPQGGKLGAWRKGQMVPEFDAAMETLEIGAVSPEPVETPFGFHVIMREDTLQKLWAAWGLIVAWDGAVQIEPKESRSEEQARQLVQGLQGQLTGANFDAKCAELSDVGPNPTFIGPLPEEAAANPVTGKLLETIRDLAFDEVGGPVDTPNGFVFLKRIRLEQRSGAHILVAFEGAQGGDPSITRSKEEARQKASELIGRLEDDPTLFSHLAREESDGPSAQNGGSLGMWFKGRMTPEFEVAIDGMEIDEISSEPVETPFGYHVLQRLTPKVPE